MKKKVLCVFLVTLMLVGIATPAMAAGLAGAVEPQTQEIIPFGPAQTYPATSFRTTGNLPSRTFTGGGHMHFSAIGSVSSTMGGQSDFFNTTLFNAQDRSQGARMMRRSGLSSATWLSVAPTGQGSFRFTFSKLDDGITVTLSSIRAVLNNVAS